MCPKQPESSLSRQWLTIDQVAQFLEISRATAYRLIHERRLQHVRISNVVKVHVEQLRTYLRDAITAPP